MSTRQTLEDFFVMLGLEIVCILKSLLFRNLSIQDDISEWIRFIHRWLDFFLLEFSINELIGFNTLRVYKYRYRCESWMLFHKFHFFRRIYFSSKLLLYISLMKVYTILFHPKISNYLMQSCDHCFIVPNIFILFSNIENFCTLKNHKRRV